MQDQGPSSNLLRRRSTGTAAHEKHGQGAGRTNQELDDLHGGDDRLCARANADDSECIIEVHNRMHNRVQSNENERDRCVARLQHVCADNRDSMMIHLQKARGAPLPHQQRCVNELPVLAEVEEEAPVVHPVFPEAARAVEGVGAVGSCVRGGEAPDVGGGPERVRAQQNVVHQREEAKRQRLAGRAHCPAQRRHVRLQAQVHRQDERHQDWLHQHVPWERAPQQLRHGARLRPAIQMQRSVAEGAQGREYLHGHVVVVAENGSNCVAIPERAGCPLHD